MKVRILTIVIVALMCSFQSFAAQERSSKEVEMPLTKETLKRLLPMGPDMMSDIDITNRQTLISYGSALLPVIAEVIGESTNTVEISRLVDIAREVEGDHSRIVMQLHKLLDREKLDKLVAIEGIRNMGKANDAKRVLRLLDDKDESVRINAARALSHLGDKETLTALKAVYKRRKQGLKENEIRKDYSFKEINAAIDKISTRTEKEQKK